MNGLELARRYYEEFGKPMLETEFSDLLSYLAVGFVGSGSEHYGFDDEVSRDHDFEPGFCIFLPGEDIIDLRQEFRLGRAYAKLPKEYAGFKRQNISPVGGNRNGVIRIEEFYMKAVGAADGNLSTEQWLMLPDYALAEAVNGEVFMDNYGEFSRIRKSLMCMPENIKLKRLAGNLLIMAQSGQYNFVRCMKHGEPEAAQLACVEFVNAAMKTVFLLRGKYMPYYKWSFRAFRGLDGTEELSKKLSFLLLGDNSDDTVAEQKHDIIEEIASETITQLQDKELTKAICGDLEKHAYSVNDKITDGIVRNMNILVAVGDQQTGEGKVSLYMYAAVVKPYRKAACFPKCLRHWYWHLHGINVNRIMAVVTSLEAPKTISANSMLPGPGMKLYMTYPDTVKNDARLRKS